MPDVFVSQSEVKSDPQPQPEPKPELHHREGKEQIHHFKKGGRFSAFNYYPKSIHFETQDNNEEIILLLRQHPIVNLGWIFITIVLLFCPGLIASTGVFSSFPSGYLAIFKMVWYLVTFMYAMERFFMWYFNVFFVTTRRVIDVDFWNLVNKRVSDAEIEMIQDVTYSTHGPIGTIFNFGNVLIQTASEITEFGFLNVPDPEKVADVLDDLRAKTN